MEGAARALGLLLAALLALQAQTALQNCALPKPRNVHFISRNMQNVVHWSPPAGLGDGVLYTVKYRIYGPGKWREKLECTDIDRTWCDLTNETYDYEEQYFARVKITMNGSHCSNWEYTDLFNPFADTKIDPPVVKLSSGDRFISIYLTAPEKWKRNSEDKSLYQIFPHVEFKVYILNTKTKREWNLSDKNRSMNVTKLDANTTYCVTVQSLISGPYATSQPSKQVCTTTQPDNTAGLMTKILFGYVLPAILAVLCTLAIGYAVHKYIHVAEKKPPANLQLQLSDKCHENVFTPDINNFISIIVINGSWKSQDYGIAPDETIVEKKPEAEKQDNHHVGYLLQGQDMATAMHDEFTYNRPQQCVGGLSALETESRSISGIMDYGLVLSVADTGLAQVQKELMLGEEILPAENVYKSQIGGNVIDKATTQFQFTQQNTVTVGMSEVRNHLNPIMNCFLQEKTDTKVDEDQCSTIVLDWDRLTGRLNIPNLSDLECKSNDEEEQQCDQSDQNSVDGLLSTLYINRTSQEVSEEDEEQFCLLQFKGKWDLHIQM